MEMQLQTKDTLATLHLDPRTKLYLLIVGNVALFLAPSLLYEIALVVCVVILGILVGAKRFTVRMAAVYAGMVVLHIIGTNYLTGTLQIAIVTFTVFIRKIFPCAMLGGILVSTTRVNEFMAAMNRIHMPKAMVIPLTVMLRYFPNIAEINNLPTENEKQGTTQFADTQADVRFENVSFSYDGKRDAVSHVSFSAKPGTITALVGPSGSGKSTLLNLIPGFVTPKNGRILLNWKDAATLKHSDLVRHVSVVFQEVYLFQDTMMNNIRMGNQSATDEQVVEAAKKAHCHEFIEKLPQGYQTVISEGGASLSGGERQRVAIARAILKDSPIILLDEALSSLDAENAVAIQKGIEEMIKGKTVFLVSHTLSYIQNSDQILVLSDGILQGCGKHEELLQTVPLYQTMWEKEKSIKNWKLA